jgi:hypothetical protein
VPRRPGGGEPPSDSIEAGLRDLARDPGPDIRRLSRGDTTGLQAIMLAARTPPGWSREAKATAVLTVIQELIQQLSNPRWRAAALAALRLPADHYLGSDAGSLAGRWRTLARREQGQSSDHDIRRLVEAYRGYWSTAANHLSDMVERRFEDLNTPPGGWSAYSVGLPPSPPDPLAISFDRTDVLYRFRKYQGLQSISYRWLIAHAPTDHYEPVGWYYNDPNAPVEIVPLANCSLAGSLRDLPQGGRTGTLKFARTLYSGERYFFAYMIVFNSQQPCRPTVLYDVRGQEMRSLTVRAQFDPAALPYKCWYLDVGAQSEGSELPLEGAPELLQVAPNGYTEHSFELCQRGRKYGLRWLWSEPA